MNVTARQARMMIGADIIVEFGLRIADSMLNPVPKVVERFVVNQPLILVKSLRLLPLDVSYSFVIGAI